MPDGVALFNPKQTEPIKVVRLRDEVFVGQSWGARCNRCATWLTKYETTAEQARQAGLKQIAEHECRGPGELPETF